jgi:ABC-type glycerol-3-phosphate transport system substrate-binding protein
MKILSTALLAAGLVALSACGGGATNDSAANNVSEEVYNVAPDDLGTENGLGNESLGNEAGLENTSADNESTENSSGNAQ